MFIKDRLETTGALLSSFFNKGGHMATSTNKGSTYYRVGSQNQQILANYWGTGKTFTTEDLKYMGIESPGARLTELRENGFNVKSSVVNSGYQGRPALSYSISRRRVIA